VDDASEGYIPTQAKILKKWRALANGEVLSDEVGLDDVKGPIRVRLKHAARGTG